MSRTNTAITCCGIIPAILHAGRDGKKSYRTATISLSLSFLLLICFLSINSASAANKAIYRVNEKRWENQDIILTLYNVLEPEDFSVIREKIKELPTVESVHWYNTLLTAAWLTDQGFSKEFKEKGDFASVEDSLSGRRCALSLRPCRNHPHQNGDRGNLRKLFRLRRLSFI